MQFITLACILAYLSKLASDFAAASVSGPVKMPSQTQDFYLHWVRMQQGANRLSSMQARSALCSASSANSAKVQSQSSLF